MQGSKYKPASDKEYSANDLNADFQGHKFTATAGQTTSSDYQVLNDCLIDGAMVFAKSAAIGDKVTFQIIDKDNVMGLGANTVLGQYVTDWYINPDSTFQADFKSAYPAKLIYGLYLRTVYDSTGANDVTFIINYKLHKILW
jgi:hypothetical protein